MKASEKVMFMLIVIDALAFAFWAYALFVLRDWGIVLLWLIPINILMIGFNPIIRFAERFD